VRAKRDGIVIREVKIPQPPNSPDEIVEAFAGAISDKTKVLAIPHVTSALGLLLPARRIIQLCRERSKGCFVVVDGAQALGHVDVNVRDLGCNAYVSSPHKWLLAPKGTGVMFVANETSDSVWNTIASSEWKNDKDVGRRFTQIGTGNQSLHKGFEAVLDFLERVGLDVIQRRIKELGDRLRAGLRKIPGVTIKSSVHPDMCGGTTTYEVAGYTNQEVVNALWDKDRIKPRPLGPGVRQSLHIYNTKDDVDRTLARISKLLESKR
jgi:selenocysteine lyase/cysteine desulfurase